MTGLQSPRAMGYSAALHVIILLFLIFGLPDFLHHEPDPEPEAYTVELLPLSEKSNVKPQQRVEEIKDRTPVADRETSRKPTSEASHAAPPPPQEQKPEKVKPEDVVKDETPAPVPVKAPPPKPKPKPKKQEKPAPKPEDDLDSILKSVQQTAKTEQSDKPTHAKPNKNVAKSKTHENLLPMSMSEEDQIKKQIEDKWSPQPGAKDAGGLLVTLELEIAQDGTVTSVEISSKTSSEAASNSYLQAAAESAVRAVKEASPLKNLPPEKYGTWRQIEMNFDPKDMM